MGNIFEKILSKKQEEEEIIPKETIEVNKDEKILKELKQMAYSETEAELGTNVQAKAEVYKLGSSDFDYISRVEKLVKDKLGDPKWVEDTKRMITNEKNKIPGIKLNDELYKSGHGILESYAQSKEADKNKRIEELENNIKSSFN